jgi:hypothetical protein
VQLGFASKEFSAPSGDWERVRDDVSEIELTEAFSATSGLLRVVESAFPDQWKERYSA